MTDDFEKAFSDFLDRREYDQAENALFAMVRIAFTAGWRAAGGNPPAPQKIFQLIHITDFDSSAIETDITEQELDKKTDRLPKESRSVFY